jgi:hypothetical protein
MKQISGPHGIEIFSNIITADEAEYVIDDIESSVNGAGSCNVSWGTPELHSPDISCLRGNEAINISQHSFMNKECDCGLRELDSRMGKIMLKCLESYAIKYGVGFSQDEGFIVVKQGDKHIDRIGIDDNPFVNRLVSMNMPLNLEPGKEYMRFHHLDYSISLSSPSLILFPSNFLFAYSKNKNEDLYEVQNYLNDNPTQEYLKEVFSD